jgi:uncharacterized integral membrane protein (TIGR00697 family)
MSGKNQRTYKYYDLIMAGFVTVLLCSNLMGAMKIWTFNGWEIGAGIMFFPISYYFGDILTEVYGFKRARRVVWAGFAAQIFASGMAATVIALPPAPSWGHQDKYEYLFGSTYRITFASILAFMCGEFVNSVVLAKMKVWTKGKFLWMRTIGSTVAGEGVDSIIFYPVAFLGIWPTSSVIAVMISNYCLKVLWEVIATPVTYPLVAWLKKAENEDYYDRDTKFTPFSLET